MRHLRRFFPFRHRSCGPPLLRSLDVQVRGGADARGVYRTGSNRGFCQIEPVMLVY